MSLGAYKLAGFGWIIAVLFVGSIASVGWGLYRLEGRAIALLRVDRADLLTVAIILVIFAPLYLAELYRLPYPIHNDEVRLMVLEAKLARPGADLFGVSEYLSMPILLFSSFGWAGQALGGIALTTMRAVHAGLGVLIVIVSYALFRSTASRLTAFGAAGIVGINHTLWMLSRMALWDNSALLLELIALTVLLYGIKRRSPAMAFLGGVAAGLCFYVYLPARAIVAIWTLFIFSLAFYFRGQVARRSLVTLSSVSLAGCLLIITPLLVTNTHRTDKYTSEYRFLLTATGLEHQRLHALGASGRPDMTTLEGYLFNVEHGLAALNSSEWDNGGMYANPEHGFVDPLTGILLWVGLGAIANTWRRGDRARLGDLLAVVGFMSLWLTLAFVVNQAPNYTRMLGLLPFAAYLAAKGLEWLSTIPRRLVGSRIEALSLSVRSAGFVVGLLAIGVWNLGIVGDYIVFAWEDGSIRGATARYIDARAHIANYSYHLFAGQEHRYYTWGEEREWREWIGFFTADGQQVQVEPAEECGDLGMNPPFTAFMSAAVWEQCGPLLVEEYPKAKIHYTHPSGSRLAVEVLDD